MAIHEAGHTVVANTVGLSTKEMYFGGEHNWLGTTTHEDVWCLEEEICVDMGGRVADELNGRIDAFTLFDNTDDHSVVSLASVLGYGPDEITAAYERTVLILGERWGDVTALADKLLSLRKLNSSDIEEVIGPPSCRRPGTEWVPRKNIPFILDETFIIRAMCYFHNRPPGFCVSAGRTGFGVLFDSTMGKIQRADLDLSHVRRMVRSHALSAAA